MIIKTETAPWLEAFRNRPYQADEPAWLGPRRKASLDRFAELGLPTRREEDWRYTDLRVLERGDFTSHLNPEKQPAISEGYFLSGVTFRIVFVNGYFSASLSKLDDLPKGVWLGPTSVALTKRADLVKKIADETEIAGGQAFLSLNGAFFKDGFVLAVEPGVTLDRPIEILHLAHAGEHQAQHLRNLVQLGTGSRAAIVESFAGDGSYWTNAATSVELSDEATLQHVRLQDESLEAVHFASVRTTLGKKARYDTFTLTLGARLSRHDITATISGEGAHCALGGAFLLRGQQDATTVTLVDHAAPGGETRELYKGVVDDRSHGAFLGKIAVRPDAQKTDAHQLSRNLLLSPRASVDTKPELEIYADDVKCSHGATVGDLDETALFYLQARGIPMEEARRMLIDAFAAEAIETVADEGLRDYLRGHLQRWLAKSGS